MDYGKFSKQLAIELASDPRTTRLLNPAIIPSVVAVVTDALADFEGKDKVPLPTAAPNPENTVKAVTHVPPVLDADGNIVGSPEAKALAETRKKEEEEAKKAKAATDKRIKEAVAKSKTEAKTEKAEEVTEEEVEEFMEKNTIDFSSMTKQQALDWYNENKEDYGIEIEHVNSLRSSQLKRALNKAVNG